MKAPALGALLFMLLVSRTVEVAAANASIYDLPTAWRDDTGATVTFAEWRGHRVAVTMSFTSCQRTCPFVTMRTMRRLEDRLRDQPEPTEFIVVTLDPRTDTPAVLAAYKQAQGITSDHWHFLSGTIPDTERLARRLGVAFTQSEGHIFHSFKIVGFDASGQPEYVLDADHEDVDAVVGGLGVQAHPRPPDSP
jgi:protein SCO1/2